MTTCLSQMQTTKMQTRLMSTQRMFLWKNWRKLSLNYHQIPSLSVLLTKVLFSCFGSIWKISCPKNTNKFKQTSFIKLFCASSSNLYNSLSTMTSPDPLWVIWNTWPKNPLPRIRPTTRSLVRNTRWVCGWERKDWVRERSTLFWRGEGNGEGDLLLRRTWLFLKSKAKKLKTLWLS